MAKKGKVKVSRVKRNNQTTNKMKKQGKLRLQRHRTKVQKQKPPQQTHVEFSSDSDSESRDEWADMLDEEEQQYIMNRLVKEPQLLSNVQEELSEHKSAKKRKKPVKDKITQSKLSYDSGAESNSNSELEDNYEQELSERPAKKFRPLLPIKTKEGLMERNEEVNEGESEEENDHVQRQETEESTLKENSDAVDSDMEGTVEDDNDKPVSTIELLAARRDKLQHDKLRIGALCSSLLENPEKKLKNLYPILYLMEERLKDGSLNLHSIRKLATLSAFEVFKDILPDYHIRHQDYSNVKLKKDTLAMYKYEKELLEFYKRYLQRLEKATIVLRPKKGDTRKVDPSLVSLALASLRCLGGMLVARPSFNFATNIAQSLVPLLDCGTEPREIVTQCCVEVFTQDNRGEITLTIVRLINQLVKRKENRLHPQALDCLLSLKIRNVELDAETDLKNKKKQEEKHKKRIVNLSKKEKKRAKKLKEVERELKETEAQESENARRKLLTEVTRTVFHIYFRLLKTAPHSRLLAAALAGLAKFTRVINLEYYTDLLSILARLLDDELVAGRERLLCARTALGVLADSGDVLAVDPARFHTYVYNAALDSHAGSTNNNGHIVVETMCSIAARARRVSAAVLCACAKRVATLATQLTHEGALACLLLLHQMSTHSKAVSGLFEAEPESGVGRYSPAVPSPEHCGAAAATLHELSPLAAHAHPAVRRVAAALLHNERQLPAPYNKLTPIQALEQYDGSQMSFKPSVPPPPQVTVKPRSSQHIERHTWSQPALKEYCESIENSVDLNIL